MKKKSKFFSLNLPDKIFGIDQALIKLFLPPLGLILVFIASINLILVPKFDEIGQISEKTKDVKANTRKIIEQNNYLKSIDQTQLEKDAEYLDNAVLRDKKSYLLVEIIRNVANNFGFQLESFSLAPGELKEDEESVKISAEGETIKMPVTLSMVGPQEKYLDLVSALEKTLPILFIDRFEIKVVDRVAELDLMISSYYIADKTDMETTNITLEDLKLSTEESNLISRISSFTKIESNLQGAEAGEFQKYERENPFTL